MKLGWIVTLVAAVALSLIVMIGVGTVLSVNNEAVGYETSIKAQHTQNQNVLSQYSNKIAESAQVPTMYRNDFTKVVTASMEGRYGKDGSKAAFQWLKEHNIQYDSTLYVQLQRMIEAGRNNFEVEQGKLVDKKRVYEKAIGTLPKGWILSFLGYPKIDLTKYDIVRSEHAIGTFATGVDNAIKLN